MASKAQLNYVTAIVKYFDKHPDAGVDLTVDEVLEDMDTWVLRHRVHKEGGRAWLSDADLAIVREELHRVGRRVLDRQSDRGRAEGLWLRAPRDSAARRDHRAAMDAAQERVVEARGLAQAALKVLLDTYDEQHEMEIQHVAVGAGVL